jgi:biopolymer transport protein TolR
MAAASPQIDAEGDEMISGINVTPLVDITLVLLIIFMVTTSYIVRQSMDVNLPRAAHGGENVGTTLIVVIHPDGATYVDGAVMDDTALRAYVRNVKEKEPEAKAIIAADKLARYDSVIHVIDLVKGEGISKFALNIEKEESVTVQ